MLCNVGTLWRRHLRFSLTEPNGTHCGDAATSDFKGVLYSLSPSVCFAFVRSSKVAGTCLSLVRPGRCPGLRLQPLPLLMLKPSVHQPAELQLRILQSHVACVQCDGPHLPKPACRDSARSVGLVAASTPTLEPNLLHGKDSQPAPGDSAPPDHLPGIPGSWSSGPESLASLE